MSSKLNWAINIGLLVLIFAVLFNSWVNDIFAVVFILAITAYFAIQMIRHRGGDEKRRLGWSVGPGWWRKFASDDFEKPQKQEVPPNSPPK